MLVCARSTDLNPIISHLGIWSRNSRGEEQETWRIYVGFVEHSSARQWSAHATRMTSFCSLTFTLSNRSNVTLLLAGTRSIAFWLYQSWFQFDLRDVDLCTSITLPIENHDCVLFRLQLLSKSLWYISLLQLMKRRVTIEFDIYCWCFHKRLLPNKLGLAGHLAAQLQTTTPLT